MSARERIRAALRHQIDADHVYAACGVMFAAAVATIVIIRLAVLALSLIHISEPTRRS